MFSNEIEKYNNALDSISSQCNILSVKYLKPHLLKSCQNRCGAYFSDEAIYAAGYRFNFYCKCDDKCESYKDCCYDYWHYCKDLTKVDDFINTDEFRPNPEYDYSPQWLVDVKKQLRVMNSTLSSFLKHLIFNYYHGNDKVNNDLKLMDYSSCTGMSNAIDIYVYVVDKCPIHAVQNKAKKCEDKNARPVYVRDIGIFHNVHCALCHGYELEQIVPVPVIFYCKNSSVTEEIKQQGNKLDPREMEEILFTQCHFTYDIINASETYKTYHGTPGMDPILIQRQNCLPRRAECPDHEFICKSFIIPVNSAVGNPFCGGYNFSIIKKGCYDPLNDAKKPMAPSYVMLFSLDSGLPSKLGTYVNLHIGYSYDALCGERGKIDVFTNNCIDLANVSFVKNDARFYFPHTKADTRTFQIAAVLKKRTFSEETSLKQFRKLFQTRHINAIPCNISIEIKELADYFMLKRNTSQDNDVCSNSFKTPKRFEVALQYSQKVFNSCPKCNFLEEIIAYNVEGNDRTGICGNGDQLLISDANVFNFVDRTVLAVKIENEKEPCLR